MSGRLPLGTLRNLILEFSKAFNKVQHKSDVCYSLHMLTYITFELCTCGMKSGKIIVTLKPKGEMLKDYKDTGSHTGLGNYCLETETTSKVVGIETENKT